MKMNFRMLQRSNFQKLSISNLLVFLPKQQKHLVSNAKKKFGMVIIFIDCSFCTVIQHNCPRRDFAQKAKSRGGTLLACILRKVLTVEIYSPYTRKNLDLPEQEPRGIVG